MIDPLTERRYADCRELMELWRRYHDYFKLALSQNEALTPEQEHEFITVKSRIAMLHDSFMDSLDHDQNIGQNVLAIVTRSITLKHMRRMSTAEVKKIELEWHESYLLLNETIGLLEDKRRKFAGVKQSVYYRRMYIKKTSEAVRRFLMGWVFKSILVVVVLMVGVFAFMKFGGWEWIHENPWTKPAVIKFEDMLRMAWKNYPYRDLASLTRMDTFLPANVQASDIKTGDPNFGPDRGYQRVNSAMAGDPLNFSEDLKKRLATRVEAFELGGAFGGAGAATAWLYLMPTVELAKSIEDRWTQYNAAKRPQNWLVFRVANVIGVSFDNDQSGAQARGWIRDQYLRIRR